MSEAKIVWIVQLDKDMKMFFDDLATKEGDSAYGNGSRYVKRVLSNFIRTRQPGSPEEFGRLMAKESRQNDSML